MLERHKRTVMLSDTEIAADSSTGFTPMAFFISLYSPNHNTLIPISKELSETTNTSIAKST